MKLNPVIVDDEELARKNLEMLLERDEVTWKLNTLEGETIRRLTLVSRKIFGKVIGIKEIIVN